jgi:hypothetical protein
MLRLLLCPVFDRTVFHCAVYARALFAVVALLVSITAQAATFTDASTDLTAPATNSMGNFTVTLKTSDFGTHYLPHKKNSGRYDLVTSALSGIDVRDNDVDGGVTSIRSPDIILPVLRPGETLDLSLSYYLAHNQSASTTDYLRITLVGSSSTVIFEQLGAGTTVDADWHSLEVNLDSHSGETVYLLVEAVGVPDDLLRR